MVEQTLTKKPWYITGLHFECQHCGSCCSGPGEGYIWVTRHEIELLANYLKIPEGRLRRRYLKRIGVKISIIEDSTTRDCVFLQKRNGQKQCVIYPVRPTQCRVWPFWSSNLTNPDAWNQAAQRCPGINHGKHYSLEEIENIRKIKKWWLENNQTAGCSK